MTQSAAVSDDVVRRLITSLGFPKNRVENAITCLLHDIPPDDGRSFVERILSFKEVCQTLSLSKSGLRRIMAAGELKPIWLSPRRMGFRQKEVNSFVASRNHWGQDSESTADGR